MKRYEHYCSWDGGGPADPKEDTNGDWVRYDDAQVELAALRKDAERWRYWRNYWPALCRMEVARFARLDLRTTYVQSPADMDKVTDAAMASAATAVGAA